MSGDERDYYLERARRERELGSCCEDNGAALAHLKMADEYERRAAALAHAGDERASEDAA